MPSVRGERVGSGGGVGGRAKQVGRGPAEGAVQGWGGAHANAGLAIYELAEELRVVHQTKAYLKYAESWEQFLRERKLPGRTTCAKLMAIVESFPRETMLKKGTEWCFGRLRFSTYGEQLRNVGAPIELMYEGIDPDSMTAAQLEEANKRLPALLVEAMEDDLEPGEGPVKPVMPARPRKSKLARELERRVSKLGAKRPTVWTYTRRG